MKKVIIISFTLFTITFFGCSDSLVNDGEEQLGQISESEVLTNLNGKTHKAKPACKNISNAKVKATDANMEIEILASNSDFVNHIYLVSPGPATFLATDDDTGTIIGLPTVRNNQELVFEIRINDGTPVWQTGPGSRNSDGQKHAEVEKCGDVYTVNFEDIDASGWGVADEPNFVDAIFIVRPQ